MAEKDNTIGYTTLVNRIKDKCIKAFNYQINDNSNSLRVEHTEFKNYVQPVFSELNHFESNRTLEDAQIVLISAIGATGKTTLAKEMSYFLQCPIIDLGCAEVMAGSSLTGTIIKKLGINNFSSFVNDLKSGNATMIIDGLDEGFQRTKTQGYYDFLDDVISMTSEEGKSFILLGRTNAIELAAFHFEIQGIKTITYQIEPFTIEQAKSFISSNLKEDPQIDIYGKPYKDLMEYIIASIGGFFKDRNDVKVSQYERFIGYAPVLLSIVEFIKKNKNNFQKVLAEFEKDQLKGTSLIISIVEGILNRDKEMKILPQLIEEKIKDRDANFQKIAREKAYTIEEQCARVLYRNLGKDYSEPITNDERFDFEYSQSIERWIDEHPFLVNKKISNTVFEGYILAKLISNNTYKNDVVEYIVKSTGISYMFFSIYYEMHKNDEELDLSIVSYLYNSLKALDNKRKYYKLDLTYDEEDADDLSNATRKCILKFEGNEDSELQNFNFHVSISSKSTLELKNYIADVYIDAPINVEITSPRILLSAPSYINCKNLSVLTDEIVISRKNIGDLFTIEADTINLITDKTYPNIIADEESKKYFAFVCDSKLPFPLCDYQSSITQLCMKMTATQKEYYKKMRRTLIMFRSHSKGEFAKVQSKINSRIYSKPEGKLVVDALLAKGIIYPKEKLYFINKDKMNEHLGLKFDGIRSCVINNKVINFLNDIHE